MPGWGAVQHAYRNALDELADNKPDNAITDAATALQDALTLLGCDGNTLGPLVHSARTKGLLAPHNSTLATGSGKFMQWASADRSELGDGHHGASLAERDDAWLCVYVVGALILRLSRGFRPRS